MQPEDPHSPPALAASLQRLHRLIDAVSLLDVEEGTSYGTPALKLGDKMLVRLLDAATAVLPCPLEQKEILIEHSPHLYFETDHYKGWPSLLVRLDRIGDDELGTRLAEAWRLRAPKRLLKQQGL
jgi:hypothetical protein